MNNILITGFIFFTWAFPQRYCLQQVERDALGKFIRPEKDTLVLSPSQHFYIHYDIDGNDGLDLIDDSGNGIPDYIDNVGIFADSAYYMLKDKMGYEVEPADADGVYDIYIKYLPSGYYGFNLSEGNGISYLEIGSNYEGYNSPASPEQLLLITISHEYFHAIQRGYKPYYSSNDIYFLEMSSMWFEDVIVPNGNDYLDGWADPLINNPTVEFDDTGPGYELALFGHYLSSFIDPDGTLDAKNSTIMRQIWENYSSNSTYPLALSSIKNVLNGVEYSLFIECWVDFISRNLYNGIDENYYYYGDQALIDPIDTNPQTLSSNESFTLHLNDKSVAIQSFSINNNIPLFITHSMNDYVGRVATLTENNSMNNFEWGSNGTTIITDDEVHFIYGSETQGSVIIKIFDEYPYDYSLVDINPNSGTYNSTLSPVYFENQVTLHYFGHQN